MRLWVVLRNCRDACLFHNMEFMNEAWLPEGAMGRARKRAGDWIEAVVEAGDRPEGTQSIRRAFLILRALSAGGDAGLGLSQVARATSLSPPTAHRVLQALVTEGVVEQRAPTRRYVVASHLELGALRPATTPLLSAAMPHLDDAADDIGDTLFLTLRAGLETTCVARRLGSYPIQVLSLSVGVRRPIGVSASGIALLAALRADAARSIVLRNKRHLRAYGMTAEDSLAAVARARIVGYALRERGLVPGTRAVSIAFGDRNGEAPATLTVAAIARRMHPQRVAAIVERLRMCASRIETSLRT